MLRVDTGLQNLTQSCIRRPARKQRQVRKATVMTCTTLRTAILICLGAALILPCGLAGQVTEKINTHLEGTVFLGGSSDPLLVEGAKVALYGDTGVFSTVTNREGEFDFANIDPPGIYLVEVTYRGLHADENVMVPAGSVVQVSLHLKPPDPEPAEQP